MTTFDLHARRAAWMNTALLLSIWLHMGIYISPGAEDELRLEHVGAPATADVARKMQAEYVILVSIDGLRPDAITTLGPSQLPNLHRFRSEGAWTDNARTDYDYTFTLPNHTTMLTARHVMGGSGHNWTSNSDPSPQETFHSNKGAYVASCFDVAHDHGLRTAAFVSKSKFSIIEQSYNASAGAPDLTGVDNGKSKIDVYRYNSNTGSLTAAFLAAMRADPFQLAFLHLRDPDARGHVYNWLSAEYFDAVRKMDQLLGGLFDLMENDARFRGNTAIILTSDHGGIGLGHSNPSRNVNYVIPFYAWGAGVFNGSDLYELNRTTRTNPALGRPVRSASLPPIRNGDAANLALFLLGLPGVLGSTINSAEKLAVNGIGNQLPIAVLTGTPTAGFLPLSVDFDGLASSDADGSIARYDWDFGDGASGSGATTRHTYVSVGTYTVTLTVTDEAGAIATATETIKVSDPNAVTMSFQDGVSPTSNYGGTRDADIGSDEPTTFFGTNDEIYVDGSPDVAILIKWDLSSLPAGSMVSSAEITLWATNSTQDSYELYEMKRIWVESESNWHQYSAGNTWETAGANGASDRGSVVLGQMQPQSVDDFYTLSLNEDGIALIQRWVDDPSSNRGFIALDYANASDGAIFHSREASAADTRPKLTLDYAAANHAPTASFTASPQLGTLPLAVNFDASASSDADGTITDYTWDFGDGSASSGMAISYTYAVAGQYLVMLVVTDNDGATGTATDSIIVMAPNQAPMARFTITPRSGTVPLSVDFDASASTDSDGMIERYLWNFGDGSLDSSVTVSHTYTNVGTYAVTLAISDNDGALGIATDSVVVIYNTSAEEADKIPDSPVLWSNFPNPSDGVTSIRFELPDRMDVHLQVIDVLGRVVGMLVNGSVSAGAHDVLFDASGLPSGVYVIRLRAGPSTMTRKMLRL